MFVSLIALSLCGAPAEPHCYVLLFGGQASKGRPNTAHTWATFACCRNGALDSFTISWLPCEMPVRPFALAKPGRNYGLHETLQLYLTGRSDLDLWGPWEISPRLFDDAAAHKSLLDSGAVRFKTFDGGPYVLRRPIWRTDVSHCVHAVTRCNEELRICSNPIDWYGALITRRVARSFEECGMLVNGNQTHDWLLDALDLRGYPLVRRSLK
jgi:hypothetical protein